MGDGKQLIVIVAGVFVLTFLPIIVVIALILGAIAGLDDEEECPPGGAYPSDSAGIFGYPVPPDQQGNRQDYVQGDDPEDPDHAGIDFVVPVDTPVLASADGEVVDVSGDTVKIQHADDFQTWYQFVKDVSVDEGDQVTRGQEIAKSDSGNEDDPGKDGEHLHFEIRVKAEDDYVPTDPAGVLSNAGPAPSSTGPGSPGGSPGNGDGAPSQQELNPYRITMAQETMDLTEEQIGYVNTIIGVGKDMGLPPRAWVIALAVVAVESHFDPMACCDHSSIGLFQQLDAWGSREDRLDPATSARMFFRGDGTNGLGPTMQEFPDWETEQLWLIAGESQEPDTCYGSSCEDLRLRYGKWEEFAINLVLAHYGAAPIPGGGGGCEGQGPGVPAVGDYAFVLEPDSIDDTNWLTKPHHDYPAADIPVPTGTRAYAVTEGTVTYVGGSCGTGLVITAADGVDYIYCHGESLSVPDGAHVNAGDEIMVTDNTGNSTGPHLHFGVRTPDDVQRCPQDMLIALYNGQQPPAPTSLASSGCSY